MSRSSDGSRQHLAASRVRGLILSCVFVAAVFNGMLASGVNRTLVDMPAWQHVGAPVWAEFSRWADIGTNGLILYPLEGIGGAVLSIGAAIIFYRGRRSLPRSGAVPIYAALLALGGMLATTQAAPTLLGTRQISDPAALQQALNGFAFWGGVRAVFQFLGISRQPLVADGRFPKRRLLNVRGKRILPQARLLRKNSGRPSGQRSRC